MNETACLRAHVVHEVGGRKKSMHRASVSLCYLLKATNNERAENEAKDERGEGALWGDDNEEVIQNSA